jgi:hypothetical protein
MGIALRPLFLVLAAPLAAQNLISYDPGGAGASFVQEYPLPSPAFAVAAGGPGVPVGLMPAPARPLLAHPLGSIAADDTMGILYTTNGMVSIQRSW